MQKLEAIIGLEVHAQIATKTKMFCSCDNDAYGKDPNTTVCPICMGHPGTLPVPNAVAVSKAVIASLALQCEVQKDSHFDRKHYFYPDLPSGYQISQYDFPLSKAGTITFDILDSGGKKTGDKVCRITRLHLENDAGKLTHRGNTTLCDYNRAGTPLMEIVTEPDLRNAEEAVAFAQELRRILIAAEASTCDMFKGEMRFDASISLREVGTEKLNPRSEIKNLNSFKALEKALIYEEKRLRDAWEETGGPLPTNITVGWQDDQEKTRMLREKEDAQDYRYFPEPDIPPLYFTEEELTTAKMAVPPLPRERRLQYVNLGLEEAQAMQLLDEPVLRALFDATFEKTKDTGRASGIVLTQIVGALKASGKTLADAPTSDKIVELLSEIEKGTISANTGKAVLETMVKTGKNASTIIAEEGLQQISDTGAIEVIVDEAIAANPKAVEDFKAGKQAALGSIVGFVMKKTKGQANPQAVNEIVMKKMS